MLIFKRQRPNTSQTSCALAFLTRVGGSSQILPKIMIANKMRINSSPFLAAQSNHCLIRPFRGLEISQETKESEGARAAPKSSEKLEKY